MRRFRASRPFLAGTFLLAAFAAAPAGATETLDLSHPGFLKTPGPAAAHESRSTTVEPRLGNTTQAPHAAWDPLKKKPIVGQAPSTSAWIRVAQPHTSAHRATDVTMKRGVTAAPAKPAPNSGPIAMETITLQHEGMNAPKPAPSRTRQITMVQDVAPKGPPLSALDDMPGSPPEPPKLASMPRTPAAFNPKDLPAAQQVPWKKSEGGNNGIVHKLPTRLK